MTHSALVHRFRPGILLGLIVGLSLTGAYASADSSDPMAKSVSLSGSSNAPKDGTALHGSDSGACAIEVAGRVQSHYDQIEDLAAEFKQVTQSVALAGGGTASQSAQGRVVMAKPGRMRWEYGSPEASIVVSDGSTLWIYDVDAKEAQRMVATDDYLSGAALQFLMGRGVIADDFSVTSESCSLDAANVDLELVPRGAASYERLALRVDPKTGEVQATTLVDLFGNVTTISFGSLRTNLKPAPGVFQFSPPRGVDVIDLNP